MILALSSHARAAHDIILLSYRPAWAEVEGSAQIDTDTYLAQFQLQKGYNIQAVVYIEQMIYHFSRHCATRYTIDTEKAITAVAVDTTRRAIRLGKPNTRCFGRAYLGSSAAHFYRRPAQCRPCIYLRCGR